ncbi:hypothetical protein JCM17039_14240 [Blautia glucerasea]
MHDKYLIADGKRYILGGRNTYNYFLGDFPGHKNYDRDVLVVCDEPEKENSVNQLSEYFETIWNQEDSGYFHNNKKLANRKSVKNAVLELQNSYQKYFEENKERICETNYTDETFETEKITLVSNPIHTGSKEPVVWYQLGELMKNAKNRVKIHTPYIICNDMMYNTYGIRTIGELARTDPSFLERQLGKMGLVIYSFANGWDDSPVSAEGYQAPIKSIGNSTTTPRDLENDQDVQIILMALAESVAARLRKHGFKCNVVSISIRDNGLFHFSRQRKLQDSTDITDEIMSAAYQLFRENYHWPRPIRSLGIRADDLVMGQVPVQLDLFMNEQRREKQEKLDRAVDDIRRRFGYHSVQRAFMYQDKILSSLDAQGFHTVHPVGYFNGR